MVLGEFGDSGLSLADAFELHQQASFFRSSLQGPVSPFGGRTFATADLLFGA